jgi:hypothetical protein
MSQTMQLTECICCHAEVVMTPAHKTFLTESLRILRSYERKWIFMHLALQFDLDPEAIEASPICLSCFQQAYADVSVYVRNRLDNRFKTLQLDDTPTVTATPVRHTENGKPPAKAVRSSTKSLLWLLFSSVGCLWLLITRQTQFIGDLLCGITVGAGVLILGELVIGAIVHAAHVLHRNRLRRAIAQLKADAD